MTRVEIVFPDLSDGHASDAAAAIAGALTNNYDLNQLADTTHGLMRTFEVSIDDPALPTVNGLTYQVTVGQPGEYRLTQLRGTA